MSISAQQRTMILGAIAVLGVGGVIVDSVLRSKDAAPKAASPAAEGDPAIPVLPGAPPGDLASLQKRYRPIVLKGPFKTRDFKKRRAPRPAPKEKDSEPVRPTKPGDLVLRLTSFLGQGSARVGLFEERSSGTALYAKSGATLAGVSVASVGSDRVVVRLDGKERSFTIGESLSLPPTARSALKPLRPKGSVKTEAKKVTGSSKLPELSEEKKMSILERLKARRRASKKRAEAKNSPNDKAAPGGASSEAPESKSAPAERSEKKSEDK